MKKTVLLTGLAIFMISCNLETREQAEKDSDTNNIIEISIIEEPKEEAEEKFDFYSTIRPDEYDLAPGVQYIDELRFVEFNDDFDYGFSLFVTEGGDTISLLHNDPIDNSNKGKLMKVLWEIGTFYEAGEGEEQYYKESLISYEIKE